jgi:hypothetical protein
MAGLVPAIHVFDAGQTVEVSTGKVTVTGG